MHTYTGSHACVRYLGGTYGPVCRIRDPYCQGSAQDALDQLRQIQVGETILCLQRAGGVEIPRYIVGNLSAKEPRAQRKNLVGSVRVFSPRKYTNGMIR